MKRTLNLTRETLSELTTSELSLVAGGAPALSGPTCQVADCLRDIEEYSLIWCRTV